MTQKKFSPLWDTEEVNEKDVTNSQLLRLVRESNMILFYSSKTSKTYPGPSKREMNHALKNCEKSHCVFALVSPVGKRYLYIC
jgi:hypothetical protein